MRGAAAGHALAGRLGEARRLIAQVHERDPTLRIANLPNLIPFSRAQNVARWTEGLRKAGLPAKGADTSILDWAAARSQPLSARSYALFHHARKRISPTGFPVLVGPLWFLSFRHESGFTQVSRFALRLQLRWRRHGPRQPRAGHRRNTGVGHLPMPRLRPRRNPREAKRLRLHGLIKI